MTSAGALFSSPWTSSSVRKGPCLRRWGGEGWSPARSAMWSRRTTSSSTPTRPKRNWTSGSARRTKRTGPSDSTPGKIAHLVTYLFAAVEAANAVNKILEMVKKFKKRSAEPGEQALATAEAVAAALDLVVAFEDPVRELAHHLHAAHAVGAGAHAGGAAASGGAMAASQSQAKSLVEKSEGAAPRSSWILEPPPLATTASSYTGSRRGRRFRKERRRLSAGNALVSGGSLLMATGSAMNAFGMAQEIALLTAASAGVIVAAVVITLVGFIVINEFSKTAWQSFARYCCFGKQGQDGITRQSHQGHESWSGGDFSEWEPDVDGFTRQIEVFYGAALRVPGVRRQVGRAQDHGHLRRDPAARETARSVLDHLRNG